MMKVMTILGLSLLTFVPVLWAEDAKNTASPASLAACSPSEMPCPQVFAGKAVSAVISANGEILAAKARDGQIQVFRLATQELLATLSGSPSVFERNVQLSADGKLLAYTDASKKLRIWDVENRQMRFQMEAFGPAHSLAFAPDSQYLAAAHTETTTDGRSVNALVLWNLHDMSVIQAPIYKAKKIVGGIVKDLDLQYIQELAFSADGHFLLVGNRDADQLLIYASPSLEWITDRPYYQGFELADDTQTLLTLKGNTATLARFASGSFTSSRLIQRPHTIASAALSKKADRLALGGYEGSVRLFDAQSGEETQTLQPHAMNPSDGNFYAIQQLSFSQDDRYLIARGEGSSGKKVWIWDIASGELRKEFSMAWDAGAVALSGSSLIIGIDGQSLLLQSLGE